MDPPPPSNLPPKDNGDEDVTSMILQSIRYQPARIQQPPRLQVLDQLLLPDECVYLDIPDCTTAWNVIRKMQIRGAPLIAVVAILSLAVELQTNLTLSSSADDDTTTQDDILRKLDYLGTSRPTAVNLFHAIQEVQQAVQRAQQQDDDDSNTTTANERMIQAVVQHAEFMLERDIADNRAIGQHGAHEILKQDANNNNNTNNKITILTLCNTGSLATAGYGTALGVVRALHAMGSLHRVVALETRPYNQGSRLTCFELLQDQLPHPQLLCDSMAAAYMKKWKNNNHNNNIMLACVVGADRVAANGDTANKIGTYQLAVTAQHHQVPFYVAAPLTTLDVHMATGEEMTIEERPAQELRESARAPPDMPVWNPA